MASKLEELGKQFRIDNTKGNTYQNTESGGYGATHPNALSDGDSKGKGTGVNYDTYNGGSDIDVNGTDETILVKSNVAGSLASNATTKIKFKVQTKQIVI